VDVFSPFARSSDVFSPNRVIATSGRAHLPPDSCSYSQSAHISWTWECTRDSDETLPLPPSKSENIRRSYPFLAKVFPSIAKAVLIRSYHEPRWKISSWPEMTKSLWSHSSSQRAITNGFSSDKKYKACRLQQAKKHKKRSASYPTMNTPELCRLSIRVSRVSNDEHPPAPTPPKLMPRDSMAYILTSSHAPATLLTGSSCGSLRITIFTTT